MGEAKESLRFGDSTLLGHLVEQLLDCTWPVLVVARDREQALPPLSIEAEILYDDSPGAGPLAALATGMRRAQKHCDALFVCGCDMPFLDQATAGWMARQLGGYQAVVPEVGGHLQPLCSVYRTSVLPAIEALLGEGVDTAKALIEKVKTRILAEAELGEAPGGAVFTKGVNTPEEYQAALEALGK